MVKTKEMSQGHQSVLLNKIIEFVPPAIRRLIDATVGSGGHAQALLSRAPQAELLGLDQDESMVGLAKERLSLYADRVNLMVADFRELKAAASDIGWDWADVILLDLGISSLQLDDPSRGFSFRHDGPLDMRLSLNRTLTAATIVNSWSLYALEGILRNLGEERSSRAIASAIIERRKRKAFERTADLADLVEKVSKVRSKGIHPATNTFRALRMAVNDELGALNAVLPQAADLLSEKGLLMVISFHSLEDRIVKNFIKSNVELINLTKKPITPDQKETGFNPRSRSAKLRIAQKTTGNRDQ